MWLQQEYGKCHTTRAIMALLQETFPGHVISRRGDVTWKPKTFDLTALDIFCEATRKTVFVEINFQLLSI